MNTVDAADIMGMNRHRIPHSALYTSATWRWARLPYADVVTPKGAQSVFRLVNGFMFFYRLVNPRKISLKHNLLHRHAAIDELIRRSSCQQIIEIAAGFSPRGCMVSSNSSIRYIEVDLPDVISLKRHQLAASDAGRTVLSRSNFRLLAGDITARDFFDSFANEPTFIVSEGIMMYFCRDAQMAIWRNIADFLRRSGGEYVFDYIPIDDEPSRSALGQWLSDFRHWLTNPPPPFAYDERTRQDVANDLIDAGFSVVEPINTGSIARSWALPHSNVRTRTILYHCRAK